MSAIYLDVMSRFNVASLNTALGAARTAITEAGAAMSRAFNADEAIGQMGKLREAAVLTGAQQANAADVAKAAQLELQTALRQTSAALATAGEGSDLYTAALKRQSDAMAVSTAAFKTHNDTMAASAAAAGAHSKAMDAAAASTGAASRAIGTVGAASFVAAGAAIYETTKKAADFQAQSTKIVASGQETAQTIRAVNDGILQMAGQVGTGVDELQQGMYGLEKAGFHAANGGLDVLKAGAEGAKAESADLNAVVGGLATTLNDSHTPTQQAADVMSKLVVAAGASRGTFQDFTGSLHSVEPVAFGAQISMEDLWAVIAQGSQSGASLDQVTENMRNAINSLKSAQGPAQDAMQQLGINAQDVSDRLGDGPGGRGLAGTIQYLSNTVMSKMNKDGLIPMGEFKENAQALDNLNGMLQTIGQHSPEAGKLAQAFHDGSIGIKEFTVEARKMGAENGSQLLQFGQLQTKLDGFSTKYKNGQSELQNYNQVMKTLTGTVAGQTIALQVTGDNADKTNTLIAKLNGTTREANGTVKGFDESQETLNGKMAAARAAFGAAATELGTTFVPIMTDVANVAKAVADVMERHPAVAQAAVSALEVLGATWLGIKAINIVGSILNPAIVGLNGMTVAEDAAAAGAGRLAGALRLVVPLIAAVAAGKMVGDNIANTNHDHYFNKDGSMVGSGDQWIVDHLGPIGKFLEPPGAKTTDELNAAKNATPGDAGTDPQSVVDEVNRRLAASGVDVAQVRGMVPTAGTGDAAAAPSGVPAGGMGPVDPSAAGGGGSQKKPKGDKNDPIWISASNPADFKGSAGGNYDPFDQFKTGGFTPASVVGFFTALLANQAMGNPYGQLQAQKRGESAQNPLYVSNVDVDKAQTAYDRAVQGYGPDSTEAQTSAAKLQATRAAVGTTGGYYDPTTGGFSAHTGTTSQSQDQVASAIIQEGMKRGLSRDQIVAGLNVAKLESNYGANPMSHVHQNQAGTDVEGIFQQDPGYSGNHDDPHNAAGQFFDRMIQRARPGDSAGQQAVRVQVGTYGGSYVDSQGQGSVYDRLAPQLMGSPSPSSSSGWGGPTSTSILDTIKSQFGGGGPGESPVFKRPSTGLGSAAGASGHGGDPFAPGGALAAMPGGPLRYGPPGLPGQMGAPGGVGPFATPHGVGVPGMGLALSGANAPPPGAPPGGRTGTTPNTGMGSHQQAGGQGGGFGGIGGAPMAAAEAAMNAFMPGSGAALQAANRTVGFLGQLGAIGIQGLMETFLPNDSELADPSKSLVGKIVGGVAGAHQNSPNTAGQAAQQLQKQGGPAGPDQQQGDPSGGGQGGKGGVGQSIGTQINVEHMHNNGGSPGDGRGVANDLARQSYAANASMPR